MSVSDPFFVPDTFFVMFYHARILQNMIIDSVINLTHLYCNLYFLLMGKQRQQKRFIGLDPLGKIPSLCELLGNLQYHFQNTFFHCAYFFTIPDVLTLIGARGDTFISLYFFIRFCQLNFQTFLVVKIDINWVNLTPCLSH